MLRRGHLDEPVERDAGCLVLERPCLRELSRNRPRSRQVRRDQRVAQLACTAGRTAVDPASEHQATPHPGPDRDHHQVTGDDPQLVVVRLGERRDRRIVVHEHGHSETLPQHLAQRDVGERHVDR